MNDRPTSDSDEFDDRYTSATADLSAGGVALSREGVATDPVASVPENPAETMPRDAWRTPEGSAGAQARPSFETVMPMDMEPAGPPRPLIGAGAAAALGLSGAGVWLFIRARQERRKPINRLRSSARKLARDLGQRVPEPESMLEPQMATPGGALAALLIGLVLGSRLARRSPQAVREEARNQTRAQAKAQAKQALQAAQAGAARLPLQAALSPLPWAALADWAGSRAEDVQPKLKQAQGKAKAQAKAKAKATRKAPSGPLGLGLGGLLAIAAVAYLAWRVISREQEVQPTWTIGNTPPSELPNQ